MNGKDNPSFQRVLLVACVICLGAAQSYALDLTPKALPRGFADFRASLQSAEVLGTRKVYVDAASGNDGNDGSKERPLKTISAGVRLAEPGTIVWILPGRYVETVDFKKSGMPTAWIRLIGDPSGDVVIDGEHRLPGENWGGLIYLQNTSFIELRGLRLLNSTGAAVFVESSHDIRLLSMSTYNTWSSGLQAWRSSRISMIGNTVRLACQGKTSKGHGTQECITLASCTESEVAYNHVFDRQVELGDGGEGIDCKQACRDVSVHHNLVHHLHRLGIYIDAYDREEANIRVFDNVVHDCSSGIVLSAEMKAGRLINVDVHSNTLFDNRNHGIEISDFDHDGTREDIEIYDNRIWRNGQPKWGGGISVLTRNKNTQNIRIRENVIIENGAWQICIATPVLSKVSISDNSISGFRGYDGGTEREVTGTDMKTGDFKLFLFDHADTFVKPSTGAKANP